MLACSWACPTQQVCWSCSLHLCTYVCACRDLGLHCMRMRNPSIGGHCCSMRCQLSGPGLSTHSMCLTAGVLAGVFGTAATGYILKHGTWDEVWGVAVALYLVGALVWNAFSTGAGLLSAQHTLTPPCRNRAGLMSSEWASQHWPNCVPGQQSRCSIASFCLSAQHCSPTTWPWC
jgi:hypothetical protein